MKPIRLPASAWICTAAALLLGGCRPHEPLADCVDTRVGTAANATASAGVFGRSTEEFGQTLPAVLEPNGMNFWTPQTRASEAKCVAPYYWRDSLLQGFRNSHWIVGGCTQDYGSMTLMPVAGPLRWRAADRAERFVHDDEVATPAYYAVNLPEAGIRAELTGRSRSAIFRFRYPAGREAWLVVTPNSDEGEGSVEIDPEAGCIRGCNPVHRIYQGWGKPAGFEGHFVVELGQEIAEWGVFRGDSLFAGRRQIAGGPEIGAYVRFKRADNAPVAVKAASSFTDAEGAQRNLAAEIPHWDFDRTRRELTAIWEEQLGRIELRNADRAARAQFYGALYRASFLPRTFNDVDGRYPAFAGGRPFRHTDGGANYYDDFSIWDTYRALHPLLNLLTPTRAGEMMQSLVDKYEQGGWLPIFPCWNSYTAAMIGDHAIALLGDAWIKGVRNFDIDTAWEAMVQNAFDSPPTAEAYADGMGRRALRSYLQYGYIPLEDEVAEAFHRREQVSRTLEYAYDDFVLAQVARSLLERSPGDAQLAARRDALLERARNYRHVIDPATGYARGRHADGTFGPSDPFAFEPFVTEGAPCHYTWYVPHDPYGLMACMGGRERFEAKLDSLFSERRYWHGNEPCHQIAYLYGYAGAPWKTQRAVRRILETEYLDAPGGLSGNDDAGQMSAWYLFSAMGFYPVCPGTPLYLLGSPTFPEVRIRLENGRTFRLIARDAGDENRYIQWARLNGRPYDKCYLLHDELVAGGTLEVQMGPEPNEAWGRELPPDPMQPNAIDLP